MMKNEKSGFADWCRDDVAQDEGRKERRARLNALSVQLDREDQQLNELQERQAVARNGERRENLKRDADECKARCEGMEAEMEQLQKADQELAAKSAEFKVDREMLQTALNETETVRQAWADMEARVVQVQAKMRELEGLSGDATSEHLAQYSGLQAAAALLPKRIECRGAEMAVMERGLKAWCQCFVACEMGPRGRRVANHARAKVRDMLKGDFQGEALAQAVESSDLVQESNGLQVSIESNPIDGACGYAERLLSAFDGLVEFEEKLGKRNRSATRTVAPA